MIPGQQRPLVPGEQAYVDPLRSADGVRPPGQLDVARQAQRGQPRLHPLQVVRQRAAGVLEAVGSPVPEQFGQSLGSSHGGEP